MTLPWYYWSFAFVAVVFTALCVWFVYVLYVSLLAEKRQGREGDK